MSCVDHDPFGLWPVSGKTGKNAIEDAEQRPADEAVVTPQVGCFLSLTRHFDRAIVTAVFLLETLLSKHMPDRSC